MQSSNPASPLALYARTSIVEVRVKSVSPIGRDVAMVRFDTLRSDSGAQPQPAASWVAVVRFRYSQAPMALEDRFVNPLGFQVTSYRRDAEVLAPEPSPSESVQDPEDAALGPESPSGSAAPAPYYDGGRPPLPRLPRQG